MPYILLCFILVPIIEIYVLVSVGTKIGALNTILAVIVTAVIGTVLLRQQGVQTLAKVQRSMQQGIPPAVELLEAALLLVGGVLLLTPGFITDLLGFSFLIPQSRHFLATRVLKNVVLTARSGRSHSSRGPQGKTGGNIIEGEYRQEDESSQDKD